MRLEYTCQNCQYEELDIDFDESSLEACMQCPNCEMVNEVKIGITLMGRYNEDKEER